MKVCQMCGGKYDSHGWECPQCGHSPRCIDSIYAYAPEMAYEGDGFDPQKYKYLASVEEKSFWFRARNNLILWAMSKYAPDVKVFFEVGCGTGFVLSSIAQNKPAINLYGSEIFIEGLNFAKERLPLAKLMQMDARNIPFENEFPAVGCFDVLEHIENDELALTQLYKAVKPGGVVFLTVPQHQWLWSSVDEIACHMRRYSRIEIESKVSAAGFTILNSTSFVVTLLPAMMLSRYMSKKSKDERPSQAELELPPFLNKIFYLALMAEVKGLSCGLRYPVGGSRFIVARK